MTIRAACDVQDDVITTDVAIIGAGPAGLSLAAHLNRDCLVIESGNIGTDVRTHHVFHSISTGEQSKIDAVRVRGIGGASLRWTGRCTPLDAYDFADRPWISKTGWPVDYDEMLRWSDKAAHLMQLPSADTASADTESAEIAQHAQSDNRLVPAIWRFAEPQAGEALRFGAHLKHAFQGQKRSIIYAAHCTQILASDRQVKAVQLVTRGGRSMLVKARHFVIASGCVEACRMLLAAQRTNPALLADVTPWLGRGFGQHLRLDAGEIEADRAQLAALQRAFGIVRKSGKAVVETGMAINPEYASKNRLGNASIVLRYVPNRGYSARDWLAAAKGRMLGNTVHYERARVLVEMDTEQTVDFGSYIGLADELDPLGQPRAKVHWTIGETDRRTAHCAMKAFGGFISWAGLGQMTQAAGITPESIDTACRRDSLHQLGGTRMSESPADGVVDANLQVHGTANVSVVGGSVFATGGHANPTQTIVALALRLAQHLNAAARPAVSQPAALQVKSAISGNSVTA